MCYEEDKEQVLGGKGRILFLLKIHMSRVYQKNIDTDVIFESQRDKGVITHEFDLWVWVIKFWVDMAATLFYVGKIAAI